MSNNTHSKTATKADLKAAYAINEEISLIDEQIAAVLATQEDDKPKTMSSQLQAARLRYEPCVSYSNRLSLHNGDDVASLLQGATPEAVMGAAEVLLGLKEGELVTRYAHLNPGQRRMNSGNRIRAAFKNERITLDQIQTAIAA